MKRSYVLPAVVLAAAVMALSVIITACGGGGGGAQQTPKIQISGTIGTGYTPAAKPASIFAKALTFLGYPTYAYALTVVPTVDKIIAIPMERGSLNAWQMANSQSADITSANGGEFTLSLAKDKDWLLVLINSTAIPATNRFVGSVAIDAGSSDSLLSLPATASALTSLNIGTINGSITYDGLSTYVVSTTDFSLNSDQLTAMAKTDDIFRNAKNIINNYNAGTYYQLRPNFAWEGDLSTLSTTFSNPAYVFNGMTFQLDTNSPTINMTQLCSIGTVTVGLYPSVPVSDGTYTYDPTNPVSNSGATACTTVNGFRQLNGNIYATDAHQEGGPGLSYSIMPRYPTVPLPAATWTWKETVGGVATDKAVFDVDTINPPVNTNGTPKGFVPSFKIITNPTATTKIDSVKIEWHYYNGTTYTAVAPADLAVLKHFISSMEIGFDVTDNGTRRTCDMYFDPTTTSEVIPGNFASSQRPNCALTWYYNDSDPAHAATNTGLMGFYESGGFGYYFHFFKPFI